MSDSKPTQDPKGYSDPQIPLRNLNLLRTRIDSLQRFLSQSITTNTPLSDHQIATVSDCIETSIHHAIVNGAALVSYSVAQNSTENPRVDEVSVADLKSEPAEEDEEAADCDGDVGGDIVELDAVELLAEHIHFCEICGKGFRRDANLRMHMRAHGNQFKTVEALAAPVSSASERRRGATARFSCPFDGCNRNKLHGKFRPLKSIVCLRNHFKRSHCPKMYSCTRCQRKSFSVLSDLKSHMKHCGESKWRCTCGTTFSRKDKLFGHIALFEGHMPVLGLEEEEKGKKVLEEEDEGQVLMKKSEFGHDFVDNGFPDGFFDDLGDFSSWGPL